MASAAGETEGGGVIREDFDSIMNDFLDKYEVLGGKMRPSLGGSAATPADKLELVRRALGEARIKERKEGDEESDEEPMPEPRVVGENKEKWDAETILSEYMLASPPVLVITL